MAKLSFQSWLKKADDVLWDLVESFSEDLPDCDWYGMYEDGVNYKVAAKRAIKNAGGY